MVEKMVCEDLVERQDTETEDVIEVVEMVEMLGHQVRQTVAVVVTETESIRSDKWS